MYVIDESRIERVEEEDLKFYFDSEEGFAYFICEGHDYDETLTDEERFARMQEPDSWRRSIVKLKVGQIWWNGEVSCCPDCWAKDPIVKAFIEMMTKNVV